MNAEQLMGATVLDRANDRVGEVRQVVVDAQTAAPAWVGVRIDSDGEVLVPLDGASWDEQAIHAAAPAATIRSAPQTSGTEPTDREQERLNGHYGIPCVRTPRSPLDLFAFEDAAVSYSVNDDAVQDEIDEDRSDRRGGSDEATPLLEQRGLGEAMEQAEQQRAEGVSGHMLGRAPGPIDGSAPSE